MTSTHEIPFLQTTSSPDGVETWAELVRAQQQTIQAQQQTIETLERRLQQQQERIEQLEAELRAQKKLKGKPKLGASRLNDGPPTPDGEAQNKRPGSAKRSKKLGFEIHQERIIVPEEIPATAKFNGYRDYDVQELKLERHRAASVAEVSHVIRDCQPPSRPSGHRSRLTGRSD